MTTPQSSTRLHDPRPLLVLGASGKTGRRVLARLHERGEPTRAVSRSTEPPFSWNDEATWSAVLSGTRAAYVVYAPDLIVPGAVETVARFAAAAKEAGLERLVLLSGRGEEEARAAEQAMRAVGPGLTVVRASWFVQNLTEGDFAGMVADGLVALPAGSVKEPFVDCDDIADVAVAALLDPTHQGRTYEVTGPRSLTFADLTAEIATASGHPVAYVQLSLDQAASGWRAAGLPDDAVWLLETLFGTLFDGRNDTPGDGVQSALGRPARDVRGHLAARAVELADEASPHCGETA